MEDLIKKALETWEKLLKDLAIPLIEAEIPVEEMLWKASGFAMVSLAQEIQERFFRVMLGRREYVLQRMQRDPLNGKATCFFHPRHERKASLDVELPYKTGSVQEGFQDSWAIISKALDAYEEDNQNVPGKELP
jgi:hypothetical protein